MKGIIDSVGSEDLILTSTSADFRSAVSHNIHQIMKAHPALNSLLWEMILKIYELPLFRKLVLSGKAISLVAKTEFGLFRYRPFFINEILMAEGLYEPHVKEVFKPEKGETVIDIGSNIGFYTLRASRYVGATGKVISIEPNPETFGVLKSNIMENNCNNVVALCCAAGAEDGYANLYVPSNYPAGSRIVQKGSNSGITREKVRIITIDSLVRKLGLKRIDWMKIDVEGSDTEVIIGCKDIIERCKPRIIIETGNARTIQLLAESGYCVKPLRGVIGFVYAYPEKNSQSAIALKQAKNDIRKQEPSVVNLMQEHWEVLIVLDACRYDFMEKVYRDYFPQAKLNKRISPGTWTVEWASKVFRDSYPDRIYFR
jgi:FkbM family methyltransferase